MLDPPLPPPIFYFNIKPRCVLISIYQTKNNEVTVYREKQLSKMNRKPCFLCPVFTEYYCSPCQNDLCRHCKAVHVIDLDTKHHKVTIYTEKFKYLLKREKCTIHRHCIYDRYCEPCKVFYCEPCTVFCVIV